MKTTLFAVLAASGLAMSASAQQLPVLLTVDITDPSNVVFSSTGASPAITDSSASIVAGVSLLGLFQGAGIDLPSTTIGGNLSPAGNPGAYNRALNNFASLTDNDLNFWATGVGGPQEFDVAEPAFTGSLAFNLSSALFPAPGTIGNIIVGDTSSSGSGATLGSWQVIPTPGAAALFGIAGLAAARRRRV